MADPQDHPHDEDAEADPARKIGDAYAELSKQLGKPEIDASILKDIGKGFRKSAGIDMTNALRDQFYEQIANTQAPFSRIEVPVIEPDTRPSEIAANTERTAELIGRQNTAIAQLVDLTINNLALSQRQQEQAKATERFTRRMTWTSVILTAATVVVSLAALVVALATSGQADTQAFAGCAEILQTPHYRT